MSSKVLLILNHNFVASAEAETIVSDKKREIEQSHPNSEVDQFMLSRIVLNKEQLIPNHYDFIYYLNEKGENASIPNHATIKQSLRMNSVTPINLRPSNTPNRSKVGSKLSSLKFKRLNKAVSPSPSLPDLVDSKASSSKISAVPLNDAEKKLRYLSDDSESDEELINEDELIQSTINTDSIICLREPNNGQKRRKACKNCTCGLAEREMNDEASKKPEEVSKPKIQFSPNELTEIDFTIEGKTGGCGSCSLGDAFRCSGCPFLGLPAFKPGQVISLASIDDDL